MMVMFKNDNSSARLGENDFYKITSYILNNIGDLSVGEAKNYVQLSYRLKSHLSLLELSKELNDLTQRKLFPNQVILNQMLQQLFGMRKMTLAFELYDLARIKGILNAYVYQSLIIGIARSDRPNLARVIKFYESAKHDGQLNAYIVTSVMEAILKAQDASIEQLKSVFRDAKNLNLENSYVYSKFLRGFIQFGVVAEHSFFEQMYSEMNEKKSINIHNLKAFLELYVKVNVLNPEFIFEIYRQNKQTILSSEILYALIWKCLTCATQKDFSSLYTLFDDYSKQFATYAPFCVELINLYAIYGAETSEQLLDVYQKADDMQLVNEDIHSKLMSAFLVTSVQQHQPVFQFYSKAVSSGKVSSLFFENMLKFVIQSKMASHKFYKQILKDILQSDCKTPNLFIQLLDVLYAIIPFPFVDMIELVELNNFSPEMFHKAFRMLSEHITEKNFDVMLVRKTVELYFTASAKNLIQDQDNSVLLNMLALYPNRNPDIAWPLINKLTPLFPCLQVQGIYHINLKSFEPGQVYFSLKRFFVEFLQGFHDEHMFHLLISNPPQIQMIARVFSELSFRFNDMQTTDGKIVLVSKSMNVHKDGIFASHSAFKPYQSKKNVSRETIQLRNS